MPNTHTPGPWTVEPVPAKARTDPDMLIPEDDLFWIAEQGGRQEVLATVHVNARAEANAALLAQAPVLDDRLRLITRAALDRIDGDSPHDQILSEIVGIAEGDPHWLQHARANYDLKYARLVTLATKLVEHVVDEFTRHSLADTPRVAHELADIIEQEILPEMVLGENGRTINPYRSA